MENILSWLFLNSRDDKDDILLNSLGNTSTLTPATSKVKQITTYLNEILLFLPESDRCEVAIKSALSVLTRVVKKMNKTIVELVNSNSIGQIFAIKLSERTNDYFIKFLGSWLISDQVASYFVFDLGGFEFLLDTIGVGDADSGLDSMLGDNALDFQVINSRNHAQEEESKEEPVSQAFSSLFGSDLATYLEENIKEFKQDNVSLPQI